MVSISKEHHVEFAPLSSLHLLPIKICRTTLNSCDWYTSTKLYTWPNLSARAGCSLLGTVCDEPGTTAVCLSGLTRHKYMGETGALCNLTSLQLPVIALPRGRPPTTAARRDVHCIHALSASSTPECHIKFRVLDKSRDLNFSYREIKFSKINTPSLNVRLLIILKVIDCRRTYCNHRKLWCFWSTFTCWCAILWSRCTRADCVFSRFLMSVL